MLNKKENPQDDCALAGDIELGASGAEALPRRIERYGKARERASQMGDYLLSLGAAAEREAVLLANCGNYLQFRHYYTVDQVRLHAARLCRKHLLCPLCAIRRGAKVLKAYLDKYEAIRLQRPDLVPYFVTVTVKNGPDLLERFKHLRSCLQRYHKRRHGKDGHGEILKADGAVWTYEVTNRGNGWHPHVHAIWLCSAEPQKHALRAEWEAITGDSFMCDVRPISDPVEGFLEVFKYAVKFGDLDPAQNWEAYKALSGFRLLSSFGAFYGVDVPDALTDEPLDDLPYFDLLYRFVRGVGYTLT